MVVRRIPKLNRKAGDKQPTLFDTHRFTVFFTTNDVDTVVADQTHRQYAIIEQTPADLKDSALAHLPAGVFAANATPGERFGLNAENSRGRAKLGLLFRHADNVAQS
jgi:hypothetical protein